MESPFTATARDPDHPVRPPLLRRTSTALSRMHPDALILEEQNSHMESPPISRSSSWTSLASSATSLDSVAPEQPSIAALQKKRSDIKRQSIQLEGEIWKNFAIKTEAARDALAEIEDYERRQIVAFERYLEMADRQHRDSHGGGPSDALTTRKIEEMYKSRHEYFALQRQAFGRLEKIEKEDLIRNRNEAGSIQNMALGPLYRLYVTEEALEDDIMELKSRGGMWN